MRDSNKRGKELLIDIHIAFVLRKVARSVRLVEHSPLSLRQIERVLQALEH